MVGINVKNTEIGMIILKIIFLFLWLNKIVAKNVPIPPNIKLQKIKIFSFILCLFFMANLLSIPYNTKTKIFQKINDKVNINAKSMLKNSLIM